MKTDGPCQQKPPTIHKTNTRKRAADQGKGKLPLFKLRRGEEDEEPSMQVDGTEEEEKTRETEATLTIEDIELALTRGGHN